MIEYTKAMQEQADATIQLISEHIISLQPGQRSFLKSILKRFALTCISFVAIATPEQAKHEEEVRTLYEKLFEVGRWYESEGGNIDDLLAFIRQSPIGQEVIEAYEVGQQYI